MPAQPNPDKIRDIERQMATLDERVDTLPRDFNRGDRKAEDASRAFHDLGQGLALLTARIGRIEKAHDERQSRRWDLWMTDLGGLLGIILTISSQVFSAGLTARPQPSLINGAAHLRHPFRGNECGAGGLRFYLWAR